MNSMDIGSTVNRGIIVTFVSVKVEVTYNSTVSNILIDVIHCIRLHTSGERDHTLIILCLRVPDDTLDETLRVAANRVEVNLCGGGVETHVLPLTTSIEYIIQGVCGQLVVTS